MSNALWRKMDLSTVYCRIATDSIIDCHRYIGAEDDKNRKSIRFKRFYAQLRWIYRILGWFAHTIYFRLMPQVNSSPKT